ncbi:MULTISPECIES: VCBS domain-containing protein [unclassified Rhizobium]|uniref:VCBS domain-containing protein n=1 Tax=unclassified Rhizobium TaxID=2613769 RepID=UPI001C82EDD0|nr:autoaggregation protein (adhering protein) [Rhizobium sp. NZLR8]MBX5164104.1 autoaggregation protein (adhering protein) [Rhizobium sp. NZLR4b]MBX5171432.1 autoaggregation protein (adhering protein) [Rhizobium sp. NZLR1b]MBX5183496.1 autoaggregation protein (adhering protein) [Rhizobium sp. NZLR5]MBX5193256.1 autoaggregation protein (adhering protein) [Rhizobium sp. NZLR3b]MBX5198675.1 autoaggregation protein (adhering protein) [Rhizobium sp. NZLR10]MBX5208094.1 autoaggregation protein (adh
MANHKPVAVDVYLPVFDINDPISGDILENTSSTDVDGDRVRLNFVNGQRIPQPADPNGPATSTTIEGKYGTLTVYSDGGYTYALDHSNPVVSALGPGDQLVDQFNFKISDGKGATDFGLLNIAVDLPERGDVFVNFEDVGKYDFPTGYKGFDWGAWRDGDDATVQKEADGNHVLSGGVFWTPILSADGGTFQIEQFSVANGTSDYDNVLTIEGHLNGNIVFSTTVNVTADSMDAPQVIDLSAWGKIDYLVLDTEPVITETSGPDYYGARYDDFHFIV